MWVKAVNSSLDLRGKKMPLIKCITYTCKYVFMHVCINTFMHVNTCMYLSMYLFQMHVPHCICHLGQLANLTKVRDERGRGRVLSLRWDS